MRGRPLAGTTCEATDNGHETPDMMDGMMGGMGSWAITVVVLLAAILAVLIAILLRRTKR